LKLLFRSYLASLREREELDAILPDLLSELGYTVYSRPQRGTAQAGVDVAAVGTDDDGERKLFLFSVKQGDLTRQSWDGTPQALRSSLNEIMDTYVPTKIPRRYQKLRVVICLVFGGDMQEQVRGAVSGYIANHSNERISFDEWNGDKLAELLMRGVLREEIMPKALRINFQKAVALVDEPEVSFQYFAKLVYELSKQSDEGKLRVRTARQLYIALWVLFVWGRDIQNVEAAYQAAELVLLKVWDLLRFYVGKTSSAFGKAIQQVLAETIRLYLLTSSELIEQKIFPHVDIQDGLSAAVRSRSAVDVNIKLFDILGRIAVMGLWAYWIIEKEPDLEQRLAHHSRISEWVTAGYKLIRNNSALYLPLQDQQAIDIALFLMFTGIVGAGLADADDWLNKMTNLLSLAVRTHGRYPCVFTEYRDLVSHPHARTDEYRKEATSGSVLIPLIAAFLSAFGNHAALEGLVKLKANELQHCTLQLWMPDETSEDKIYIGDKDHGITLLNLPISPDGKELLQILQTACVKTASCDELSAISAGHWPIVLTACRHFRYPVPPQFWLNMVAPTAEI
jgi:hypothetical protein